MLKAMIVDDEAPARSELKFLLDELGQTEVVAEAASVREAIEKLKEYPCDVMFLDVNMPEATGLQLAEALQHLKFPPAVVFVTAYSEFAIDAFKVNAIDYLVKPVTRAKAENLLLKLSRIEPGEKKPSPLPDESGDLFSRLLSYVNLHYSEPLQLSTLAQHFYINESYCSSLFHARLGMTYSAYIRQLRLEKAASLLRETTLPIKEISSRVGYSDFLYFSKSFHRQYEMAPTEYREYQASLKEADDHA